LVVATGGPGRAVKASAVDKLGLRRRAHEHHVAATLGARAPLGTVIAETHREGARRLETAARRRIPALKPDPTLLVLAAGIFTPGQRQLAVGPGRDRDITKPI